MVLLSHHTNYRGVNIKHERQKSIGDYLYYPQKRIHLQKKYLNSTYSDFRIYLLFGVLPYESAVTRILLPDAAL